MSIYTTPRSKSFRSSTFLLPSLVLPGSSKIIPPPNPQRHLFARQARSSSHAARMPRPRDIDLFLSSYAGQRSNPSAQSNYLFYSNQIPCQPDGLKYEEWMKSYENDMVELEMSHGYVQWFFPIRERGVNPLAQPLTIDEIEKMQGDEVVLGRLLRSYKMMLLFYGINFNDGKLSLSPTHKERFANLTSNSHNLLRITRILKYLSEFPILQPHAASLVLFFTAAHSTGLLNFQEGSIRGDSLDWWWSNCFRDEGERRGVREIVRGRGGFGEGKWGWEEYERWFDGRGKGGD
ncbi:hypothetical protein I302_103754 [Kwoniella bestiolae CBS 10118]|uniref:Opioid growth factor receptor (OGFr) conserved domain-containing protein n=1 Tax=Kwoniella bestiolae CBS 10118 TaxID=1296100 RepID=A0A1B9G998_9TREE|nr:hypothetical protein I302_02457 [Kwoniella bestiolae CBS 10118]OCF27614.1 hypothetical protein I302_02457 [Kwoniella bestiolae CBS 10118]